MIVLEVFLGGALEPSLYVMELEVHISPCSRAVEALVALLSHTIHTEATCSALEALTTIGVRLVVAHGADELEVARQGTVNARSAETAASHTCCHTVFGSVSVMVGAVLSWLDLLRSVRVSGAVADVTRGTVEAEGVIPGTILLVEFTSRAWCGIFRTLRTIVTRRARTSQRVGGVLRVAS